MYQRGNYYGELGAFSLKRALTPPNWLKAELRKRAGAVLRGTRVEIPTGNGTVSFDISQPGALARIKAMIFGTRIVGPQDSSSGGGIAAAVPGGWLTIGGAALGIYLLTRGKR